jgi:hypothetical protein
MREIEQHELNSIAGGNGAPQVTISRQRNDSNVPARAGTIQLSTGTNRGASGGGNAGGGNAGGGAASQTTAPKPTTTTTGTITETCTDTRITEASGSFTGFSIKMVGGCTSTRTFTTHQTK